MSLRERFEAKYEPEPMSGCWLWTAATDRDGYGKIQAGTRTKWQLAHRVSYELFVGEIPDGLFVLHDCDTPSCVNPKHLTVGTNEDNMIAASRRGRLSRLSDEAIAEIRSAPRYTHGWNQKMADKYGVGVGHIKNIRCGHRCKREADDAD